MTSSNSRAYRAVRNQLGHYSIWPDGCAVPGGWEWVGDPGTQSDALTTVRNLWTDLEGVVAPQPPGADTWNAVRSMPDRWLLRSPAPAKPVRMYVFPHCGGSVGEFLRWRDHLPDVELIGVQLPGRGPRLSEPNIDDVDELVRQITAHVQFEAPFVFFGHSGGALMAFETAKMLAKLGRAEPNSLVVSAYPAPHVPLAGVNVHDLPDDVLLTIVSQRYGGVTPEALADNSLTELLLPAYRADFQMLERYRYRDRGVDLTTTMLAVGGDTDSVDRRVLGEWQRHTAGEFRVKMFSGGHFYFRDDPKPLLECISQVLSSRQ